MKYLFAMPVVLTAMLTSQRLSAQVDLLYISDGDGLSKVTELFGQPIDREEYEGESGDYLALRYPGFLFTLLKPENTFEHIYIWTGDVSVLSSVVPGGIKVGDDISQFKDMDFSKEVTGKHYGQNGFVPIPATSQYRSYSNENLHYNYGILSRGKPFWVDFVVENGIIMEISAGIPDEEYNPNAEDVENGKQYVQIDWSSISDGDIVNPRLLLAADNTKMFVKKPVTSLQMFVYLDSDVCQKCIFVNKSHWIDFFELSEESGGRLRVNYIVEPKDHNIRMLAEYVKSFGVSDIVYYSKDPSFNEEIKSRPEYRRGFPYVYMLDDKDNVLIVGDPDAETSTWKKYKELIKSKTGLELWKID